MNYVRQLNAFGEKSIGVLNAKEQAMYLRLFLIANQLKWPEWFEVANSQLMRELGMRWKKTIIDARRELEKKGFIRSVDPGHKMKTRYHLIQLHLSTKIGHKTKKIRHKKRIDVQDSSTFLTSFKLVRQTMPSIMQTRSADGRVTFPILLRRQVA